MSGHSKWATTKHKKAVVDAKRGKLFAKLIKNIEVAARTGGAVAVVREALDEDRDTVRPVALVRDRLPFGAAGEVRTAMSRNGGSMADPGSVSYLFSRKGVVIVPKAGDVTEDDVLAAVLDAGAEEVNDLDEAFEVVSEASDLVPVRTALQKAGIDYESAEASFVPSVTVPLGEEGARKVFRLIDALEDCDDVQNVYANFDVSDEVMAAVG